MANFTVYKLYLNLNKTERDQPTKKSPHRLLSGHKVCSIFTKQRLAVTTSAVVNLSLTNVGQPDVGCLVNLEYRAPRKERDVAKETFRQIQNAMGHLKINNWLGLQKGITKTKKGGDGLSGRWKGWFHLNKKWLRRPITLDWTPL